MLKRISISLCCLGSFVMLYAGPVNQEDYGVGIVSMCDLIDGDHANALIAHGEKRARKRLRAVKKQERRDRRIERVADWIHKRMIKRAEKGKRIIGGFDDPVDKWFWYWMIAWGGAIVFAVVGVGIIVGLLALAGIAFAVIWILERFG